MLLDSRPEPAPFAIATSGTVACSPGVAELFSRRPFPALHCYRNARNSCLFTRCCGAFNRRTETGTPAPSGKAAPGTNAGRKLPGVYGVKIKKIFRVRTRKLNIFYFLCIEFNHYQFLRVNNYKTTRIRIKDIARLAGVSPGTVDRVLHNRGEVSAKTRHRIMDIISKSGYQPDIFASTLASKKAIRIAALIPEGTPDNPFWRLPIAGIEEGMIEISGFGVSLERYYFNFFDRNNFLERASEILDSRPQGVIMAPVFTNEAASLLDALNKDSVPVVLMNADICTGSCLAFIGQDSFQSGMVAAKLMHYGTGDDKDIMVVNFIRESGKQDHILRREEGFRKYYRSFCRSGDSLLKQVNIDEKESSVSEVLTEALATSPRPVKGIFVTNSRVFRAAGILDENEPDKPALIGYDLIEENVDFLKRGTIDFLISQKPREQGYKSIMALYYHLVMKKEVAKNQYLPIDIITRENLEHYTFK
jgi:LacI family transcriptional regulator